MSVEEVSSRRTALESARFVERIRSAGAREEVVGTWALKPVGRREPLHRYIRQLFQRRHFIWADARARAFSGNGGMLLGNLWLVAKPLLDGLTYYLIFGLLLQTSRGIENYIGYLLIGVFMFSYTARSLTGGADSLIKGKNVIRAFSFPRAAVPLAVVLREAIGMLPVIATMIVMILAIPPHAQVTWRWALFPAIFLLQTMFNLGLAFFAARLTAHVPDLKHVLGFITRFWLYGSAVMFSFDRFVDNPQALALLELNPAFAVLDMSRDVLLYEAVPDASSWLLLACWAVGIFVTGFIFFWRAEERYGRE
ncbi:ABC transporter permease [Georgenia sp. AZ-5]|uniref:ABC transporter permease n=1 Tax=Georgenia sp. AZ-5 TaxID=3367526 RepID=UPI00375473A1